MCLSLAFVCSEVDGIVVIYLWPPSFAYSKILTRGRYLSRHSRCLHAAHAFLADRDRNDPQPAPTLSRRRHHTRKCGRRHRPLEVHEQPLPILHLLDEPRVAEPADLIPVLALGVLLGAAPARTLEPIGILDLDVPARDALPRAVLSASRVDVLSFDSDGKSTQRQPPRRRADRDGRQPPQAPSYREVPRTPTPTTPWRGACGSARGRASCAWRPWRPAPPSWSLPCAPWWLGQPSRSGAHNRFALGRGLVGGSGR